MKRKISIFHRILSLVCAFALVLGCIMPGLGGLTAQAAGEHTLWLVGDSTVCAFSDAYYYPRYGYGTQIANYLDDTYTVRNLAASGTSSKSFTTHANYATLTAGMKSGDILMIGFGHNDEKSDDANRYTSPIGDRTTEGSFAKSLYDNYIKPAQDAGAEVILCTPIIRRTASGTWSDNNLHVANGGDYAQVIRDLGKAVNVPVVDMTALTKDLYGKLGTAETLYLHAWTSSKEASVDNTHLNIYGAKKVAWLFANAVDDTTSALAAHVDLSAGEPTKAADLVSNPDYKEPVYDGTLADSALFSDYVVGDVHFKGTAFGDLGGTPKTANYTLETDANGDMHMVAKNNKGKIAGSTEGILMYYYRIPVTSTFSLSAKATLNAFDANSQVGFGLTARDGVAIDLNDKSFMTDYVSAGSLGNGCNCFYRQSGSLGGKAALQKETLAAGSSYELSIVSNSDGYTCTFGSETPQSAGYDFALTSYDSDYVYVGMFVARNADVTFSNIHLVVDGQTVVDTRKTEHAITVEETENGTVRANASTAAAGATVKLTATPDSGYYLKQWQVTCGEDTVEVTGDSFTMPAGDVTVSAVFEAYRTQWSFRSGSELMGEENGIALQGTADTFAGLQIDATAGKFDCLNRTDWAQVNAGTVITIPVEGSSKVTVVGYSADYSVDGTAADTASQTFVCDGKNGLVVLEFTGNSYLGSIQVAPYSEVSAGTISFANAAAGATFEGITLTNIDGNSNSHGIVTAADGATMTLTLTHKANVVVTACCYLAGVESDSCTASSGTLTRAVIAEGSMEAPQYTVLGAAAGELTLTFARNMYIHDITVEYIVEQGPRNIDVWDFGGKLETDTETYTNNITPQLYIDAGVNKTFPASQVFGDLTLTVNGTSDRLYSTVAELANYTYGSFSAASYNYGDGYTAAGCYYANGTGGSNRRHVTIANVQAGDKIVVYAGIHGTADSTFIFSGLGTASAQEERVDVALSQYKKMEFVAEHTGTYKIWENATGKLLFHRVVRVPGVAVSGTLSAAAGDNAYTGTGHGLQFVNNTTGQITEAVIDGSSFTATLAAGYSYTAVLTNVVGYGFTTDSVTVTTTDAEALTGKSGVELVIEPKSTYTYSGQITGFAEGYDVSALAITLTPPADSALLSVELTVNPDLSFSATLEPDVLYTIQLSGVNDYALTGELTVKQNTDYTADITVGLKAVYAVTGGFIGLEEGAAPTSLSFVNQEDGYTYPATVTADGYSIRLRDGAYQAKAVIDGYSTITHVVVSGGAVQKDLMFVATSGAPTLEWKSDIYVGYPDKADNYATVSEAVAACAAMAPTGESQRITVHIAPGTYREQIVVATPYISFVNDEDGQVLLTWYYGIGYQYYSIDSSGYYNPQNAYDKYEKKGPADWGAAVFIKPSATAFRAEGITFENSFNRYITDEELADGVELTMDESIRVVRKYGVDVQSKAATERAAAIVIKADKAEFKDCTFLGSQDTLFTGNADYNVYFKNCLIEGQTDYIFGDASVIFDGCELRWKGYSSGSTGGYITAAKPTGGNVYWFRNCAVTAGDTLTVTPGYFGRPWGADATVWFDNTKLESADLITAAGWHSMNAEPEDANFYEYNTTDFAGEPVSTASRRGNVADAATAAAWSMESLYGSWVPVFYTAEEETVSFTTAPFLTDNGDINTPYPGHTLTVGYSLGAANDANDASCIRWYRVGTDGVETLIKTAYATVDKTYRIAAEDIGCQIRVVVTPTTLSGTTGKAASYTLEEAVRDGYEDPSSSAGDVILGDGVNVFLIGDSTVKDYSAAGMWNGGSARNEGSWGEFLQHFFNEEKVTVVNYANGGRSSRNFINEGSLELAAAQFGEGDYVLIQFGHNDCANGAGYLADRYVPLGEPDANGIYPTTAGVKVTTPTELDGKGYGSTCYTYDCGGTFKWYLLQYINAARDAGAIPVLVTPVARMYYNSDGTIKPHHDSTDTTTGTYVSSNNAYVKAVEQLAEEQDVLLIDGFTLTKELFENAYAACGSSEYGSQLMHTGDKTHCNKLGGLIEAALIADALQNMGLDISYAVQAPAQVLGETTGEQTVFSVNGSSVLTAYDISSDYAERAPYWEGVGQTMFTTISETAKELAEQSEPFSIAGANLELSNDITMYFYVYAKDVADGYYMEIVKTNADGSKVTKQVAKADWKVLGDMYYVGFNGMAAKEMADEIEITVYNAEGKQVSNTTTTSISAYALKALDSSAYAGMHTLMADLLNYGAAAQTFFKYNTANLANAAMTETHQSYATKGFDMGGYTNDAVAGAGAVGANLALETNILQNFFFDPAVVDSTMTAKVSYTNFKGLKKTAQISGSEFGIMPGYGYVIVEVSVLVPADVMSLVSVEIVDASGNVVASVSDSISSYAVRANTASPDALYIELMEYCLSCKAYFG